RRPEAGSWIMTTAHLSPPNGPAEPMGFDFQRHAWFHGIGGVGYTRNPVLLAQAAARESGFFAARLALSARIREQIDGQSGAFAAAIMAGDRSALTPQTLSALRQSNLAHLLAISGLHMGLLAGFVFGALRVCLSLTPGLGGGRWPKKIAALGALLAAACYLGLSGGNVATQRAFIMTAVALCAVLLNRRAISLRALAIAASLLLIARPEVLFGPGFQMSFAATTALVVVFEKWGQLRAGKPKLPYASGLAVGTVLSSAIAGLATLPIAAAHFNQIAHYGLLANLVSVPLMGTLVIPMAVLAVCLMPLGLDALPLRIMSWGLEWILLVAQTTSEWPAAISKVPALPAWAFACLCFGLLLLAILRSPLRWLALAPVCAALVAWAIAPRPYILISDTGTLVGVMSDQGRALSRAKGSGFVAGIWLENDGDASVQMQAAVRWPKSAGASKYALPSGATLHVARGKRGLADFAGCRPGDVAVFSDAFEGEAACMIFDKQRLRRTGSVALSPSGAGGFNVTTARENAGRRLWNDRATRAWLLRAQ
ncbi:MAG: ComEC/Rec2 family competence protein, partial [Paracoccaceae bacterium]